MNYQPAARNAARMRLASIPACDMQCEIDAELNRTDLNRSDLSSLSSGGYVVLPTVDRPLTDRRRARGRKIHPSSVEELAPLAFGSQR